MEEMGTKVGLERGKRVKMLEYRRIGRYRVELDCLKIGNANARSSIKTS